VTALAARDAHIASVAFARLEVAAVFHRKLREKIISPAIYRELDSQFSEDITAGIWRFLTTTETMIVKSQSAYRTLPASFFLRSADCLHLCAAAEAGFKEIYSNDRHLLAAAPHFGLRGIDVMPPPSKP
jgi:predicted nucleic acid-binding protein